MNKFKRLFEVMNFNPKDCRYAFKEDIPYKVDFLNNEKIYMDFYYETGYKTGESVYCLFISFYSLNSSICNSVRVVFSSDIPFSVSISNNFKSDHDDILIYYFNSNEVYFEGKFVGNDDPDTNFNISMLIDNENYINYTQMKEFFVNFYGIANDS